ncbi:MAG: SEL1-like repeat protein [Deltaproteobacteria bacterium]|nr:SEL1-like repeat protein [Deltaproteobacteria bacterium]
MRARAVMLWTGLALSAAAALALTGLVTTSLERARGAVGDSALRVAWACVAGALVLGLPVWLAKRGARGPGRAPGTFGRRLAVTWWLGGTCTLALLGSTVARPLPALLRDGAGWVSGDRVSTANTDFAVPVVPEAATAVPAPGWLAPEQTEPASSGGLGAWMRLGQQVVTNKAAFRERWEELERGARAGDTAAQLQLGAYLCQGLMVKRDVGAGLYWLRRAAEAGSADAAFQLGETYARGSVVREDRRNALAWYHQAAAHQHVKAEREVGWHLINGQGIAANVPEGLRWYVRAAEHGDTHAMTALAGEYHHANRVPRDEAAARHWYGRAAAAGSQHAREQLERMDGTRPAEQRPAPGPVAAANNNNNNTSVDPFKMLGQVVTGAARAQETGRRTAEARSFRNPALLDQEAPEVDALNARGERVLLSGFRGRTAVWLTFASPQCARSREYARRQAALSGRFNAVRFVTVLNGPERRRFASAADGLAWAQEYGLSPEHILLDPADRYSRELGIGPTPHHVLVDRTGTIRFMKSGAISDGELDAAVRRVL